MDFAGGMSLSKLLLASCILVLLLNSVRAGKIPDQYRRQSKDAEEHSKQTIIEGDILADKNLLRIIQKKEGNRQRRAALRTAHLWDGGLIPYSIAPDVSNDFHKAVRRAFRRLAAKTCIRFIPRNKTTDKHFIHFRKGTRCNSGIGRKEGGQNITLSPVCEKRNFVLHEMMHALGFLHEHSRPDRDNYVKILHWNVDEAGERNFNSYSNEDVDTLSEPYDFNSILHYDNKAFSKNGQDTIQALKDPARRFGHAKHLSNGDIRSIRKLYKCERRNAKSNGADQDHVCKDKITGCRAYTEQGGPCENNYEFMNLMCQQSCGFCGDG
ncbi:zinc metalloproteinase nas-1-like [Dendronephthya gigantea]|uniref:zinc metalloproteinase nas-1-like n=1 Tax=Dendronephthya gigantea TaxID=151771 RepID=UPI00106DC904|nr:zinc metalloproteinase nas-1-like [Dendronephthya gigantea]